LRLGYSDYNEMEEILSPDEFWSILSYTFTDETVYVDINGYLRFGEKYDLYNMTLEEVRKFVADLKSAFTKFPELPQNLLTYRGVKLSYRSGMCFNVGEQWVEKGLLSTSLNLKTAEHFAFKKKSEIPGALLKLVVASPNQNAILINENNEKEVLMPPGQSITITGVNRNGGRCEATGTIH